MDDRLAVDGGVACVPEHLVAHDWERFRKSTREEIDAVVRVLESGHLSIAQSYGMPNSEALEAEFAAYTGARYCLAVNSGTAALHCAVAGLAIEAGDEVIVPAFTFVASAMAVLHQNVIPVFADVDPRTFLIDPADIERRITARTKAIMAVHVYGLPCAMDEINGIAARYGLKVIEDSAQAYGGLYKGKKTGALADAAGFAMTTTKQLMTGEGGLMTTNSRSVHEKASMLRLFGELADMRAPDRAYLSETIGWNYKMPEMISALARVKLRTLDEYISTTQRNADYLSQQLHEIPGVVTPYVPPDRTHTYYLYPLKVDRDQLGLKVGNATLRDALLHALAAENVKVGRWQKVAVPAQPLFQRRTGRARQWPGSEGAAEVDYSVEQYPNTLAVLDNHFVVRGLVPPNGTELMDRYADAFRKVCRNAERAVAAYERREARVAQPA